MACPKQMHSLSFPCAIIGHGGDVRPFVGRAAMVAFAKMQVHVRNADRRPQESIVGLRDAAYRAQTSTVSVSVAAEILMSFPLEVRTVPRNFLARTATDIWSFGNAILSLLYGGDYHLSNPGIEGFKPDDNEYEFMVLKRMYKSFGPFPQSYDDFQDRETIAIVNYINNLGPPKKPFHRVTTREVPPADKKFISRIMKLDPRDRPTTEQLLADEWLTEESEDTRDPVPEKPQAADA
ncbi:hypothetical protein VTK26DRAFT_7393 [Humicola hyalothermophila]